MTAKQRGKFIASDVPVSKSLPKKTFPFSLWTWKEYSLQLVDSTVLVFIADCINWEALDVESEEEHISVSAHVISPFHSQLASSP